MKVNSTNDIFGTHVACRDEELDIDELLNTANYIYLGEHHQFETYDHSTKTKKTAKNLPPRMRQSSRATTVFADPQISMLGSEEKKEGMFELEQFEGFDGDKENMHIVDNLNSVYDKENAGSSSHLMSDKLRSIQALPICSKTKYTDIV